MRVVESSGELDLSQKSLGAERGGELGAQDLDRDAAFVFQVAGEIDRGHAAAPEHVVHRVAVGKRSRQAVERLEHALKSSGGAGLTCVARCSTASRWEAGGVKSGRT